MGGKAALIIVIGFMILLGIVARELTVVSTRAQGNMSTYAASTQSHNLAITGANAGLARLYQDTSWRGTQTQNLTGSLNGSFTYTVATGANGRPFLRSISLVKGPYETLSDSVEVQFGATSVQSFSLFAWMTNLENGVYWISKDTVWGRVHSNNTMYMNGTPTFMEKLTTAKGLSPKWGGTSTNQAVFKKGFETGVAPISFPTDLSQLTNAATSGGRMYTGNITLKLNGGTSGDGDGYAVVYNGSGAKIDSFALNSATFNGALGATGKVSVSGVVDGKLSIFSKTDVYITDNIAYENRTTASNDLLGLVAENNVIIADNTANKTDVSIDGSIFTRNGSFTAENYSSGSPKGTLSLLGSIVQDTRGAVGTFSGSTLKTGYSKRYRYDARLSDPAFRPPWYPGFYVATYSISSWWESVHIPKFN
jgi:hypothetical protein